MSSCQIDSLFLSINKFVKVSWPVLNYFSLTKNISRWCLLIIIIIITTKLRWLVCRLLLITKLSHQVRTLEKPRTYWASALSVGFFFFFCFRLTITTSCTLDLRRFPHDTQTCTLALESCKYYLYTWRSDGVIVLKAANIGVIFLVNMSRLSLWCESCLLPLLIFGTHFRRISNNWCVVRVES